MRKVIRSIQTRNQSGARSREPQRAGALSRVPIGRMTVPHEPLACSLSSADKTEVRMRSRSTHREGSRRGVSVCSLEEFHRTGTRVELFVLLVKSLSVLD